MPEKTRIADTEAYRLAQHALADLKSAICSLLASTDTNAGLTNSAIGRLLGIYHGHIGHSGHIPRTLLAIMESEGLVEQNPADKTWHLRKYTESGNELDSDADVDLE